MVHVPCIKTTILQKHYRNLPFPIPIPLKTKAHDLTIKQSPNFQDYRLLKSTYEDFFNQDDLDHPQIQEAHFIMDTAYLIAINIELNFQVHT
jgi:hypothetical protein